MLIKIIKEVGRRMHIVFMLVGYVAVFFIARVIWKSARDKTKGLIPTKQYKTSNSVIDRIANKGPIGFVFGKDQYHHEWFVKPENTDGHIMVVGGPGTGKSSCLAIPSVMAWRNRVFVIDIKGEIYSNTKTKRPMAKVFNPLNPDACGYDPFYVLKKSRNEAQEIRKIAISLIPIPAGGKDNYWLQAAQNLLTSGLLHYYDQGLSFIQSVKQIYSTDAGELVNILAKSENEKAKMMAAQFLRVKELGSIFSEVSNHIADFIIDVDIENAFSKPTDQTIKPIDLERGRDIFLQIPESKLDQWGRILSLITSQFLDHFEKRDEATAKPILFLLDEFPRLGKFNSIANGLATLRSKKITMCIVMQSLAQLDYIYGQAQREVIADNCQFKAVLGASEPKTQDYFSKLVGTAIQMRESRSRSTNPVGRLEDETGWLGGTSYRQYTTTQSESTSYSYHRDRIIQPHEFGTLSDIVLLVSGANGGYFRLDKTSIYDPDTLKQLNAEQPDEGEVIPIEEENRKIAEENRKIELENKEITKHNIKAKRETKMLKTFAWIFGLIIGPAIVMAISQEIYVFFKHR